MRMEKGFFISNIEMENASPLPTPLQIQEGTRDRVSLPWHKGQGAGSPRQQPPGHWVNIEH